MTNSQSPQPAPEHTPGPWSAVKYGAHGGYKVMAGSMPVATAARANTDDEANARLIAAAPELLAVLTEVRDWLFAPGDGCLSDATLGRIVETIDKATRGAA